MTQTGVSEELKPIIDRIKDPGSGGTHGREAARAELEMQLVIHLADHLQRVSNELGRSRTQWKESSDAGTEQTAALVRWTKVLVRATIAYVVLTGGLLLVALIRS